MIRARQRRATSQLKGYRTGENDEKRYSEFVYSLKALVIDLNHLANEGWVVLVEGPRDVKALTGIGYRGGVVQASTLKRGARLSLGKVRGIVVLTDLDREGRRLAGRYARMLVHDGYEVSLDERRRLLAASGGVFRHVENLSRFSEQLGD